MNHSDTPRTDKARLDILQTGSPARVKAEFAEELERENYRLRNSLALVATMAKAYFDDKNDGRGIEDPLWHVARKALKEVES
jgi:hypothetical protein